ncbi:unnamed protein product [Acanthosepion pharaonis]|uniref:Uncharacterized protein n=1 Tax=Acanthosepion pharaonis TaxID=158019 RepID=A0A812ETY0_ACAPH|nr:unnamed protein product [Sepia pharaonis]
MKLSEEYSCSIYKSICLNGGMDLGLLYLSIYLSIYLSQQFFLKYIFFHFSLVLPFFVRFVLLFHSLSFTLIRYQTHYSSFFVLSHSDIFHFLYPFLSFIYIISLPDMYFHSLFCISFLSFSYLSFYVFLRYFHLYYMIIRPSFILPFSLQ